MSTLDQLDPQLRQAFSGASPGLAKVLLDDLAAGRTVIAEMMRMLAASLPADDVQKRRETIPGPAGDLPVFVWERPGQGRRAAILHLHGGGYVAGHADDELMGRLLSVAGDAVVVSPEYRLAPEHRAPAALHDAFAALQWIFDNADRLGIDRTRIAVAGQSAGAGLAAALAIHARDHGGPAICFQFLLYPMLDPAHATASGREVVDPRFWNRDVSLWAWGVYDDGSVAASATRAETLEGLPPTYLAVGQQDLFRDECIAYASRLMAAQVPVELRVVPGISHGAECALPHVPICESFQRGYLDALARALDVRAQTPAP